MTANPADCTAEVPRPAVPPESHMPPCGPASPGSVAPVAEPGPPSSSLPLTSVPRGVAARIQAPPGGTAAKADRSLVLPGGTTGQTFTITLPAGMELLSLNDRLYWRERYNRAQVIKDAACVMARHAKVPPLGRAWIAVEYQPPDRRHRDADNPVASAKAAIDGIVLAGCLPDDECPLYVAGVWCTIGEIYPRGRLVLHLTELAGLGAGAA